MKAIIAKSNYEESRDGNPISVVVDVVDTDDFIVQTVEYKGVKYIVEEDNLFYLEPPVWANYVAQDGDGDWFYFEKKPVWHEGGREWEDNGYEWGLVNIKTKPVDPKNTLAYIGKKGETGKAEQPNKYLVFSYKNGESYFSTVDSMEEALKEEGEHVMVYKLFAEKAVVFYD